MWFCCRVHVVQLKVCGWSVLHTSVGSTGITRFLLILNYVKTKLFFQHLSHRKLLLLINQELTYRMTVNILLNTSNIFHFFYCTGKTPQWIFNAKCHNN